MGGLVAQDARRKRLARHPHYVPFEASVDAGPTEVEAPVDAGPTKVEEGDAVGLR